MSLRRAVSRGCAGIGVLGGVLAGGLVVAPVAHADDLADHLAGKLRRDPVYVSDNAVREVTPAAVPELKRAAATLGVPAYVAIVPGAREDLLALLRDRLGKDGVYYVGDTDGTGGYVRQYGAEGALPVEDAEHVAMCESDDAVEHFVRFTELVRDPGLPQKVKGLDCDAHESAYEVADRQEDQIMIGLLVGASVLTAVPTFVLAERGRRRKAAAAGAGKPSLAERRAKVERSKKKREKKGRR